MKTIQTIDSLRSVADQYDLFLVDQWGVLHNGSVAHAAAHEAMRNLRKTGKGIILISNSSKRRSVTTENLSALGFASDAYDDVVTSGELAWQALRDRADSFYAGLGRRCFMITWTGDNSFLQGQDLEQVDTVDAADFLLLAGTSGAVLSGYDPILESAARRKLPMVCVNRDFVSVDPNGRKVDCSGKVALRYEEMGGTVRYHGKPGRDIYEACLALAPDARKSLMIGDSLHHDIAGANGAGMDSILVTSGIHRFDPEIGDDKAPSAAALAALAENYGAWPTYAMTKLIW